MRPTVLFSPEADQRFLERRFLFIGGEETPSPNAEKAEKQEEKYEVKSGDSLWKIAEEHKTEGMSVGQAFQKLKDANPQLQKKNYHLMIGEKINLPFRQGKTEDADTGEQGTKKEEATEATQESAYTVRLVAEGDSYWGIAQQVIQNQEIQGKDIADVVNQIQKANNNKNLHPGDNINIPTITLTATEQEKQRQQQAAEEHEFRPDTQERFAHLKEGVTEQMKESVKEAVVAQMATFNEQLGAAMKEDGISQEEARALGRLTYKTLYEGSKVDNESSKLFRTEMTQMIQEQLVEKKVNPEAASLIILAAMEAQKKPQGPGQALVEASNALKVDKDITPESLRVMTKEHRDTLAEKMKEGATSTVEDGKITIDGTQYVVAKAEILTGAAMTTMNPSYLEGFSFQHLVERDGVYVGQMENGCEGNLVILDVVLRDIDSMTDEELASFLETIGLDLPVEDFRDIMDIPKSEYPHYGEGLSFDSFFRSPDFISKLGPVDEMDFANWMQQKGKPFLNSTCNTLKEYLEKNNP